MEQPRRFARSPVHGGRLPATNVPAKQRRCSGETARTESPEWNQTRHRASYRLSLSIPPPLARPGSPTFAVIALEFNFHTLGGLFRCGNEFPFLHCVHGRIDHQRMPSNPAPGFHLSVATNNHFDFHTPA